MSDKKTFATLAYDQIERRLNEVPINQTYLEGVLAGVQIVRGLESEQGFARDRVVDLYQLYGQVLQASRLIKSPQN